MNEYFILKCKGIAASGCIGGMTDKATEEIINLCADEAIKAIQEEPEYISSSHSTRHGYVRAVNDMQRAIEKRLK